MYDKKKIPQNVSDLDVSISGTMLRLVYNRTRQSPQDTIEIDTSAAAPNKQYWTTFSVKSRFLTNKILLVSPLKSTGETLVVHTFDSVVVYYKHSDKSTHPLTRLITVKSKVAYLRLTRRGIRLLYACLIENRYGISIKKTYLTIGDTVKIAKKYPKFRNFPSKLAILRQSVFTDYIPLEPLLKGEPPINEQVRVALEIDNELAYHSLTMGSKRIRAPKWYYAPVARARRMGYSISIRRSAYGGLTLIRRPLEAIERTTKFRVYESLIVSFLLYHGAHFVRRVSKYKVNIYFEKNSNQAEEGAVDIFRKAHSVSKAAKNFFILNKTSPAFQSLKSEEGVVENYTLKSYWLLYRANNIIATEVPQHSNVLRSGNKYLRMAAYSQKFVFLQHGITYMKAQDKNSAFVKNREGEPDYIVVGSKKERDVVVDMLGIEEERTLNVGLPIFDKIQYSHINKDSPDIVTIMLTWKPYEEHLKDFTKSTYYKTIIELYGLLESRVGKDNIRIVAHPKFTKLLASTDIVDSIWKGSVSAVLDETKLLITDYSSVCYNVFYQGGGVIFYQPDLERYEDNNGKLIPNDDEYIGDRVFNNKDLAASIDKAISDRKVVLGDIRTPNRVRNYQSINEYSDGKNIERLFDYLHKLGML